MEKVFKLSAVALMLVLLSTSCAKTYYSVDSKTIAQKRHQSVAVMPSFVSVSPKGLNKKMAAEELEKQETEQSRNFQQAIYAWMQKSKSDGKVALEIQDIETTNAKLKSAGYPEVLLTDAKLSEILGVDGIIVSNFDLSRSMAFISPSLIIPTDEVDATIEINDCANKKVIWSYRQKLSGDSPKKIVDSFMKKAGNKMPYIK